jgi:hypothetical protein
MCFLVSCDPRYFAQRYKGFDLEAIFDFPGGLVHGWQWNICPPSDARLTRAKQMETPNEPI